MRWTSKYNLHIHTVLHLNKADDNVRGHIGTELNHKAETILQITKNENDGNVSEVHATLIRDKEFPPFAFIINEDGLPELADDIQKVYDNFFIPNAAEPFIVDNVEKAKNTLKVAKFELSRLMGFPKYSNYDLTTKLTKEIFRRNLKCEKYVNPYDANFDIKAMKEILDKIYKNKYKSNTYFDHLLNYNICRKENEISLEEFTDADFATIN